MRRSKRLLSTLFLVVLGVVGCTRQNDRICTVPTSYDGALKEFFGSTGTAEVLAAREAAEACIHRWAYRLAGSPDPAAVVADTAFAGCDDIPAVNVRSRMALARSNNMILDEETAEREAQRLKRLALFHVVQARAGHCDVPS